MSGNSVGEEEKYIRLLENLAQFYNSQITAHLGYIVTAVVTALTLYISIMIFLFGSYYWWFNPPLGNLVEFTGWAFRWLVVACMVIGTGWFLFGRHLPSLRYLVARLQYYIVLTQIVTGLHMPLASMMSKDELYYVLKRRALEPWPEGPRWGVQGAIMSFFQAQLYLSFKRLTDKTYELNNTERQVFSLDEYYASFHALSSYEKRRRLLIWNKPSLLLLATGGQVPQLSETGRNQEIANLFKPFLKRG